MIQNTGDIIQGLGFVTLHAAYLEEQVDKLLTMLHFVEKYNDKKKRWQISRKIKHSIKLLKQLDCQEFQHLSEDLKTCIDLFEDRNQFIHGRIYGNFDRPDILKSGRPNIPNREITADELFDLANEIHAFSEAIQRPMIFKLPRAIKIYLQNAV